MVLTYIPQKLPTWICSATKTASFSNFRLLRHHPPPCFLQVQPRSPICPPRHQPAVLGTAQHGQRTILYPLKGEERRKGPVTTFLNWRPGLTELGSAREKLTKTGTEGKMCHKDGILGALLTLPGNHLAQKLPTLN